jgi:flagellar motor switch protein FliN/FliY
MPLLSSLENVGLDITFVLGRARMPIHKLLRMGRGAVIELESHENDEVEILANDHPIARGQIVVNGSRIAIEITQLIGAVPHEAEEMPDAA